MKKYITITSSITGVFIMLLAFAFGVYKEEIINLYDIRNMQYDYIGNGYIKMRNFPYELQLNQSQGTLKIKDIKDEVIMDMNLPNEAVPHGVQNRQKIGGWFPFDDINMPENYNSINPWGQIFIIDNEKYPENAEMHIKNLTLICFRKSTGRWDIMNIPEKIDGAFYKENYEDQSIVKADVKKNIDGITVEINEKTKGRCFHFWTLPVMIEKQQDILYMAIYCDVYVTGENVKNKFVFNVGADYKVINDNGEILETKEAIGGRFKTIEEERRRAYAINLSYDKYFDICNQKMIDSLITDTK